MLPRKKNVWIFGAWFGNKYSDNAKSLFEYTCENNKEIRAIWLTRNASVYQELKSMHRECYYIWSFKGIYFSLKAGNVIFSSGKMDVNQFFINGAKIIHLWHGAPMKKIGLDDKFEYSPATVFIKKIFFPFIFEYNTSHVVSTAEIFNEKLSSAFRIKEENVLKTGYPRNDIFFDKNFRHPLIKKWDKDFNSPVKILYLPTFRDNDINTDLFSSYKFNEDRIVNVLNKINGILIIKYHYVNNGFNLQFKDPRIIKLTNDEAPEINPILKDVDMLLTDYSGAYFDFLLTERPIIHTPFDINTYITKSRELYFDYKQIVAGPIAYDWLQVEDGILMSTKNDHYTKEREKMNAIFNGYNNGDSSKLIVKFIKNN